MVSRADIYNCAYYWGDISLNEAIDILKPELEHSYLLRKWKNGSVALASLITNGENDQKTHHLLEIEVKDCNCHGGVLPISDPNFDRLEDFIEKCNDTMGRMGHMNFPNSVPKFQNLVRPVIRKNPLKNDVKSNQDVLFCPKRKSLSLRHISQYCIASHTHKDSFKKLILPETMKTELEEGHFRRGPYHFDMVLDEKTAAIHHSNHHYQYFGFDMNLEHTRDSLVVYQLVNWNDHNKRRWTATLRRDLPFMPVLPDFPIAS